jgi:hypothetical protein
MHCQQRLRRKQSLLPAAHVTVLLLLLLLLWGLVLLLLQCLLGTAASSRACCVQAEHPAHAALRKASTLLPCSAQIKQSLVSCNDNHQAIRT